MEAQTIVSPCSSRTRLHTPSDQWLNSIYFVTWWWFPYVSMKPNQKMKSGQQHPGVRLKDVCRSHRQLGPTGHVSNRCDLSVQARPEMDLMKEMDLLTQVVFTQLVILKSERRKRTNKKQTSAHQKNKNKKTWMISYDKKQKQNHDEISSSARKKILNTMTQLFTPETILQHFHSCWVLSTSEEEAK